MEHIQAELISLFMAIVVGLAGVITGKVTSYLNKKGVITKVETNKELARIAVNAVEQAYTYYNGDEKFAKAKTELIQLMADKKIKVSEQELDLLIESVVLESKKAIKDNKETTIKF